ncbi:MAG: hypothetical protein IKK64_05330, partial [Bacteroidales bacterium]|nr:hypothetical protein [Bacteroidales bacterium]
DIKKVFVPYTESVSLLYLYSTDRLWTALITDIEKQPTPLGLYVKYSYNTPKGDVSKFLL